jgi:hypothetical protein
MKITLPSGNIRSASVCAQQTLLSFGVIISQITEKPDSSNYFPLGTLPYIQKRYRIPVILKKHRKLR